MIIILISSFILISIVISILFSFKASKIIESFYFEGYNYSYYDDGTYFKDRVSPFYSNEITEQDYNYVKDLWKQT